VRSPETVLIIPAAGAGTRLQSPIPKALTHVNGKAMIDHLFRLYHHVARRFVLVVHPLHESAVREHCNTVAPDLDIEYAKQAEPTGMLDAILACADAVRVSVPDRIWVTWCDQIGVHPDTIATLAHLSQTHSQASLIFPTARQLDPYIHLDRDSDGRIISIRQRREGDAMPPTGESDMGLFSLSPEAYFTWLPRFGTETQRAATTGERNFLPFVPWLARQGHRVVTFPCTNEMEAIGINTPHDLQRLERYLVERERQ
jgi:bifunctional UDP-N-acetylglucosamine pyrophosphorylase/glucosamine-1-phosphate N-acetyltransferase